MNYLLYLIPAILLLSGTAWENGGLSFIGFAALLGVAYLINGADPVLWAVAHPVLVFLFICAYFIAGVLWARIKFGLWLMDEADSMREAYQGYQRSTRSENASLENFKKSAQSNPWRPTRNKGRVLSWMTWWVPSLFWTLTHDFFQKIWRWAYGLMSSSLEKASDHALDRHLKGGE